MKGPDDYADSQYEDEKAAREAEEMMRIKRAHLLAEVGTVPQNRAERRRLARILKKGHA